MWYLGLPPNITANAEEVVQDTFSFLVIYNYIIPISLYVTLGKLRLFFYLMNKAKSCRLHQRD